ncbi:MAG: hypothetical protein ABIL06_11995 [Pseudomonadota bacterium]
MILVVFIPETLSKETRNSLRVARYWMLDTGCWILDTGYSILDTRYWMLDTRYWMLDTGCWIKSYELGVTSWLLKKSRSWSGNLIMTVSKTLN